MQGGTRHSAFSAWRGFALRDRGHASGSIASGGGAVGVSRPRGRIGRASCRCLNALFGRLHAQTRSLASRRRFSSLTTGIATNVRHPCCPRQKHTRSLAPTAVRASDPLRSFTSRSHFVLPLPLHLHPHHRPGRSDTRPPKLLLEECRAGHRALPHPPYDFRSHERAPSCCSRQHHPRAPRRVGALTILFGCAQGCRTNGRA